MPREFHDNSRHLTIRDTDGSVLHLEIYDSLLSTAYVARDYARNGYPDRYAVIAERRSIPTLPGKKANPGERGLFASLILRPPLFPSQAALLSPTATVALASALREFTDREISIGWPSVIYCDRKAIGKVLIESKLDNFMSFEYLIVSFEVLLSPDGFPPRLSDLIKQVFDSEANISPSVVMVKRLFSLFFSFYAQIKTPEAILDAYNASFALRDKQIRILTDGKWRRCTVTGIDPKDGALLVNDHGERRVTSATDVRIPDRI